MKKNRFLQSLPMLQFFLVACLIACSTPEEEKNKAADSAFIFYPVTKIGDGVSFVGDTLSTAGKIKQWSATRPARIDIPLSEEQREELDRSSVLFDFDKRFGLSSGSSGGSHTFPEPIRSSMLAAERTVGFRFDWYLNPMLPDVATAYPGGVIIVNPRVLATYRTAAPVYLWYFHEIAHHVLGHTNQAPRMRIGAQQTFISRALELQADEFAGRAMRKMGANEQTTRFAALDAFKTVPLGGTLTHPGRVDRVKAVMRGWSKGQGF